jgi:protein-disulfide isomerase
VDSGRFREAVESDYREGTALGVNATPTFFVNGRFLSGAQPFEAFQSILDEELAR